MSSSHNGKRDVGPLGSSAASSSASPLSDVRLFVGNLDPSVSEYDLLHLFRPHGTLRKLDFVFHRTGELKGQHKGYAFVEFASASEAAQARSALDGKPLRGREVRLNFAKSSANENDEAGSSSRLGPHRRSVPRHAASDADASKPTMLSLSKNLNRKDSTNDRIAAMEAKLDALRNRASPGAAMTSSAAAPSSGRKGRLPAKPAHLPPKPST